MNNEIKLEIESEEIAAKTRKLKTVWRIEIVDQFELSKANWEPYYGNNRVGIEVPTITAGGSVSFKSHLGKPLSQDLWEDLIHRLTISGLCVYKHDMCEWCCGWFDGHCIINLDEDEKVVDIHYTPLQRHWVDKVELED